MKHIKLFEEYATMAHTDIQEIALDELRSILYKAPVLLEFTEDHPEEHGSFDESISTINSNELGNVLNIGERGDASTIILCALSSVPADIKNRCKTFKVIGSVNNIPTRLKYSLVIFQLV